MYKIMTQKYKKNYEDLEYNNDLYDQILIEATIEAFRGIRVPGKYVQNPELGEPTFEELE